MCLKQGWVEIDTVYSANVHSELLLRKFQRGTMKQPKKHTDTEVRQKRIIEKLKKKETLMKWGLIAAGIIILLLLLWLGYATDWARGLKKDSDNKPINSSLDSDTSGAGAGTGATTPTGTNNTRTTDSTNGRQNTTTTNNSTTDRTTTNNTTTNNNSTTPAEAPTTLADAVLEIYNSTGVGETLDDVLTRLRNVGATVECSDLLLIRTCNVSGGGISIQVRGLITTGDVTSLLRL